MPYNNSGYGYRQQAGMGLGQGVRTGGMNDQYYSNNGNPGGAYNQQSNQGRYRPPTIQTPGQNTQWNDYGGYNYNIPSSNGSAGNYFDSNQQNRDQYGRPPLGTRPPQADMTRRGMDGYDPYGPSDGQRWYAQGGNDQQVGGDTTPGDGGDFNTPGGYGYMNQQPAPRPVYQRGNGSLRAALDQGRMMEQLRYGGYSDSAGGYGQNNNPAPRPEYGGMNQEVGRLQEYFGGIGEQSRPAYLGSRGYFGNNGPQQAPGYLGNNGSRPAFLDNNGYFGSRGPRPPAYGGPANDMAVQAPTPLDGGGEPYTGARPISKPTPLDYDPNEARPIAKPQPYGGPASTPPAARPPIPYGGEGGGRGPSGGGQSFGFGGAAAGSASQGYSRPNRYWNGFKVQTI